MPVFLAVLAAGDVNPGSTSSPTIENMKGYTYILQVSDGRYYVGSTENLEKRLAEHQRGEGAMFTKAYLPVKLVYTEEYPRIEDAFRREKQLQKWSHAKKEALIKGDIATMKLLSNGLNKLTNSKD